MSTNKTLLLICSSLIFKAQLSYAINAEELQSKLKNNEAVTLIDVRNNALYRQGHIHQAINIPASIVEGKRLPRLGSVIVYGDGIDDRVVEEAVMHLNAKPGIKAEVLDGGFSAWSASHTVVTRSKGLGAKQTKTVSYKKLQIMTQGDRSMALVDLRIGKEKEVLSEHFPNLRIYDPIATGRKNIETPAAIREIVAGIPKGEALILIDDGKGFAEKVADKLHAAGIKRLAILTGGEMALKARGESSEEVHGLEK